MVLCIGSVTADVIVSPVSELPAPGTLAAVQNISVHAGGCAVNSAIALTKLGIDTLLSINIGNDQFGKFVTETIKGYKMDNKGVVIADVPTTVSIVTVNHEGERSFMYSPGSAAAMKAEDISETLLHSADIVFVAGAMLLKSFDGKPCAAFMEKAQQMGKYTVMDTAWDYEDIWMPKVQDVIPHLDLFMPSYEEAAKLTGKKLPEEIADVFLDMGAKNVIVKLGKNGALICNDGQKYILPTYSKIKPVDTTGAGDSFCAGFLAGLSIGWDYRKSAALANAVGTLCVMEIGASAGILSLEKTLVFMKDNEVG